MNKGIKRINRLLLLSLAPFIGVFAVLLLQPHEVNVPLDLEPYKPRIALTEQTSSIMNGLQKAEEVAVQTSASIEENDTPVQSHHLGHVVYRAYSLHTGAKARADLQ